jgi:peptidyl-prolyl cis-trans isomerase B (cyclophilin B)
LRGKKAKQLRVDRTAEREAARRKQRQQTLFTVIVIAIILGIGGVLVAVTINQENDLAASPSESPSPGASDLPTEAGSEAPDDRPVACEAKAPKAAGAKPTFEKPEEVLEDGTDYGAVIQTSCGKITVDLFEEDAPKTVNSFVFLAEQGFFDGLEIFRNATSIGALQSGSGTNEASFDVGYTIEDELAKAEADGYPPGTLAMANAGPNTAGSQFFFVYNDLFDEAFAENRAYAVFGLADAAGQKVLAKIGEIPVESPDGSDPNGAEKPTEITYINSVKITTK